MTDYQRIKKALDFLDLKASSASKILGLKSPQIFYDIKSGKCGISKTLADKMENSFSISSAWLLTETGDIKKENAKNIDPIQVEDENSDYVPLLPMEALAGTLQGLSEGVELSWCRKIKSPVKGADWAIIISGDSMEPDYRNGSYLFIKKMTGSFIPWGNTLVLDTYDGVVVKDIYPIEGDDDYIEARSINPKYPPFKIEKTIIIGIYRVLGGTFINSTI